MANNRTLLSSNALPAGVIFSEKQQQQQKLSTLPANSSSSLLQSSADALRFHPTKHGSNVQISEDGRSARRFRGYCRSLLISRHPVKPLKFLFFRLKRFDAAYRGILRFGWTLHAPAGVSEAVINDAKYLVPDVIDAYSGWWGGSLSAEMQTAVLQPNMRENAIIYLFRQFGGPTFVGLLNAEILATVGGGIASAQASLSILSEKSKNHVPVTTLPEDAWLVMDLYGETSEVEILDADQVLRISSNNGIGFDWRSLAFSLVRQYDTYQQQQNANQQLARSLVTMTNNIATINTAAIASYTISNSKASHANAGILLTQNDAAAPNTSATESSQFHLSSIVRSTSVMMPERRAQQPNNMRPDDASFSGDSRAVQIAADYLLSLRRLSISQPVLLPPNADYSGATQTTAATPNNALNQIGSSFHSQQPPRPAAPAPSATPAIDFMPRSAATAAISHITDNSPLSFHAGMSGCNVTLRHNMREAVLTAPYFCHGHLFSNRPVALDERVYLQILDVAGEYNGSMGFGVTCADPALLDATALPADINQLLDRSEYWVVVPNLADRAQSNNLMTFCIQRDGAVQIAGPTVASFQAQHQTFRTVFFVDTSRPLYMLFSLYGSTRRVRLLSPPLAVPPASPAGNAQPSRFVRLNSNALGALQAPHRPLVDNNNASCPAQYSLPNAAFRRGNFTGPDMVDSSSGGYPQMMSGPSPSAMSMRGSAVHNPPPVRSNSFNQGCANRARLTIRLPSPIRPSGTRQPLVSTVNRPGLVSSNFAPPASAASSSAAARRSIRGRRTSASGAAAGSASSGVPQINNNNNATEEIAAAGHFLLTQSMVCPGQTIASDANRNAAQQAASAAVRARPIPARPPPPAPAAMAAASTIPSVGGGILDVVPFTAAAANAGVTVAVPSVQQSVTPATTAGDGPSTATECCVCFDRNIDCVLYRCGHMCMCAECATDTLSRSGFCPICRSEIVDVIKTYRS